MPVKAVLDDQRPGPAQQGGCHCVGVTLSGHEQYRSTHRPPPVLKMVFINGWVHGTVSGEACRKSFSISRDVRRIAVVRHWMRPGHEPAIGNSVCTATGAVVALRRQQGIKSDPAQR